MEVSTPRGPARVLVDLPASPPNLLLVLGHGAGGGVRAPDLLAVRVAALAGGAVVALVEQPYRVAGRRSPAPAGHLDQAWAEVCQFLRRLHPGLPLVAGGRSSGGRVACRTAGATGAVAVVALAFPLQPPPRRPGAGHPSAPTGRPAVQPAGRAGELAGAGVPVLVVNGDRDVFGVPHAGGLVEVAVLAGADHSLRRHADEAAAVVQVWLRGRRWERPSPR